MVSDDKRLFTESLDFFTENSVMKTHRHYTLKTAEKKIEGHDITLDMNLNVVKEKIIRK